MGAKPCLGTAGRTRWRAPGLRAEDSDSHARPVPLQPGSCWRDPTAVLAGRLIMTLTRSAQKRQSRIHTQAASPPAPPPNCLPDKMSRV